MHLQSQMLTQKKGSLHTHVNYMHFFNINTSSYRSSTAAHRSLPDIPVAEHNDNGSELYETVADKQLANAHNQSRN